MGWIGRFYGSSIGKKFVVALTGTIMVLFLLGHMLGNLQVFEDAHKINAYAKLLRVEMGLLWAIRIGLLAAAALHIVTTIKLATENTRARRKGYAVKKTQAATIASRTMVWGGVLLAGFIIYHILHFTTGTVHSGQFEQYGHADVHSRVMDSFSSPFIVSAYVLAQILLFFHLNHGIASLSETLGVSNPRYLSLFRKGGPVLAFLLVAGFASVPLAVILGFIK